MEIFKDIKGYEGLYQVSNYGKVKSLGNGKSSNPESKKERILKNSQRDKVYNVVSLCNNGKVANYYVHRLVWEAFNGPVPNGYEVNHMDENPGNNRLDNLNLVTHKENMNWGTICERQSKSHTGKKKTEEARKKLSSSLKGKHINRTDMSKRVFQYTLDGEYVNDYPSSQEAARQNGFSGGSIRECCRGGRIKQYKGYKWKYE